MLKSIFIETESTGFAGEAGERLVWGAVRQVFANDEVIGFLNYQTFCKQQQNRWEPDILIVTRELGLVVIEVKSCQIDEIIAIEANRWQMVPEFYQPYISPYRQAEKQLYVLLDRCEQQLSLRSKVSGRAIVALPRITKDEWRSKGFDDEHHTCPPIIFKDDLGARKRQNLLNRIKSNTVIVKQGSPPLNDEQWDSLLKVICGSKPPTPTPCGSTSNPPAKVSELSTFQLPPRSQVISKLQYWTGEFDLQQIQIGMQIPPGPQRIRGIAGSGKTILLCQKAVRMHLKYPEWDIALVFFTRALYDQAIATVDKWIRHLSGGELHYDHTKSKLRILHAWGDKEQPGLYSIVREAHGLSSVVDEQIDPALSPTQKLALACKRLLERNQGQIQQLFDAILIDEGQDLVIDEELQFEDKQPIYWMAYEVLKSANPQRPAQRRLIWTYDEVQSLDNLAVPSFKQVLGEKLGRKIGGTGGSFYPGRIYKSHVMHCCYRTPGPILVAAHAIGMGWLRKEGMLTGITTQRGWSDIGYEVKGDFKRTNLKITLHRPLKNSPHPIQQFWRGELLEFNIYDSREAELTFLAKNIRYNLESDGLHSSRDIMVVVLGSNRIDDKESLNFQSRVAYFLQSQGINFYIPGTLNINCSPNGVDKQPNKFWHDGAVTVSRIHRAKGNEAYMVYVVGLDSVAKDESNIHLRNQLFTALTRSKAWVCLSGVKDPNTQQDYPMYDEMRQILASGTTISFTYKRPPKRDISDD